MKLTPTVKMCRKYSVKINGLYLIIKFEFLTFLVGNKVDEPIKRAVQEVEARRLAESMRINYFETSAKENLNVEQVSMNADVYRVNL